MNELLATLKPGDAFNVLFFAGGSALMSERSLPATPQNLQRATGLVGMQREGRALGRLQECGVAQ